MGSKMDKMSKMGDMDMDMMVEKVVEIDAKVDKMGNKMHDMEMGMKTISMDMVEHKMEMGMENKMGLEDDTDKKEMEYMKMEKMEKLDEMDEIKKERMGKEDQMDYMKMGGDKYRIQTRKIGMDDDIEMESMED